MGYSETIDFLYQKQRQGIRPGLARMASLLSLLNHPEVSFRSIHIGGTNGKGSTASMVASVLQEAGYSVGLYTSPHLIDFSERMQINNQPISHEEIVRLTERIREKMEASSPRLAKKITFFEFTTALAFLYFAEKSVDFAVVEVGMGGQYDATNLLTPLVSSITNIDLDHEQFLGSTIAEVAAEKAGIIKASIPIITSASQPEVVTIIGDIARSRKAPLVDVSKNVSTSLIPDTGFESLGKPMRIQYSGLKEYIIELPIWGSHQVSNAATSMRIIESLQAQGLHISASDIIEGLKKVQLAGRLEIIQRDPLILLDGAHNPAGARTLGLFLDEIKVKQKGKHWLITGIMKDKKIIDLISPLLTWTDEFVLTRPEIERAADPNTIGVITSALLKDRKKSGGLVTIKEGVSDAIAYVKEHIQPQDMLVVTGSFYTVGEAKGTLTGRPPTLIRG